jgi:hypothetical protein
VLLVILWVDLTGIVLAALKVGKREMRKVQRMATDMKSAKIRREIL